MIKHTISLMNQRFTELIEKINTTKSSIEILTALITNANNFSTSVDSKASIYGLFICACFSLNSKIELKKMIEETKNDETFINNFSISKLKVMYYALCDNKIGIILSKDSLLKMYNIIKNQVSDNENIKEMISILIGYNILCYEVKRLNKERENRNNSMSAIKNIDVNAEIELPESEMVFIYSCDRVFKTVADKINELKECALNNIGKNRKIASSYTSIEELLLNNDKNPIYAIPQQDQNNLTPEIKYYIYQIILANQIKKDNKLTAEIDKYDKNNEQDKINKILNKFHLSLDMFINKEKIIRYCDVNNLFAILQCLKSGGLNFDACLNSGLEDVLIASDLEICSYVIRQVLNKRITIEFVEKNLGILISKETANKYIEANVQITSGLYDVFTRNIKVISSKKINLNNSSYNPNILLINPEIFSQTSNLMTSYNLRDVSLLSNPELFQLIDLLIEQGIVVQKLNFANIGNSDIPAICKRILIANSIDYPIIYEHSLTKEIVTGENFMISDENLDNFIIDDTLEAINPEVRETLSRSASLIINPKVFELSVITKLEQNNLNYEGNYVFDSQIISRNKVLRYLSTIIDNNMNPEPYVFAAILYNSYLSTDNIELIKKHLEPTTIKKDANS